VRFAIALRFAADARFARKGTREDLYEIWSLAGERATTCAFNPESFSKDAQRYSVSGHVVVQSSKRFHCHNYGLKLHDPRWKIVSVSEDICYFCFARVGRGKKETVPKTDMIRLGRNRLGAFLPQVDRAHTERFGEVGRCCGTLKPTSSPGLRKISVLLERSKSERFTILTWISDGAPRRRAAICPQVGRTNPRSTTVRHWRYLTETTLFAAAKTISALRQIGV
jgi:hypothetical protein